MQLVHVRLFASSSIYSHRLQFQIEEKEELIRRCDKCIVQFYSIRKRRTKTLRKTTPPSFFLSPPPVHSIDNYYGPLCCQCHAISVLLCCSNVYSRFNCPIPRTRTPCLSISHQYAHWELEKKR